MVTKDGDRNGFTLRINFEGSPETPIETAAFLFDKSGALLASAPFSENSARFDLKKVPKGARLFVGPALEKTDRAGAPSLGTMERLNAFEPAWKFEPGQSEYQLAKIPDIYWPHWSLCKCRVRGRVLKRSYSPGGVVVEAPVCNARVHVCEVDRLSWVIARLPDRDIFRLREDLFEILRRPLPWPPIPEPDPEPFDPRRIGIVNPVDPRSQGVEKVAAVRLLGTSKVDLVSLNPQPLPPAGGPDFTVRDKAGITVQSLSQSGTQPVGPMERSALQLQLPSKAQFSFASSSAEVIRRGFLENIEFLRPWLCHWRWLDFWFYSCDELRVVMTDEDGRFDTLIWHPCAGDKPDLYFWVEYSVGGVWTTVHRPYIPCHVWWDYPCGTEVTITVTDPRVSGCGERPEVIGKQVVVKTVGREVSMGEINREPLPSDPSYPGTAGTVKAGWIDTASVSPFGETVEIRVDFGTGLKPAGITHYAWSYRPLGSASEADWTRMQEEVTRHYREKTPPLAPVVYKSVKVGPDPDVSGYFFQVDPALPADGEKFEILDERIDLASTRWITNALPQGKYELKLELFRKVGSAMTRVDLTAEGVALSQITDPAPLSGGTYTTQPATADRLLTDGASGHTVGFRLVLHIDNRVCSGTIDSVTVTPGLNDTKCGFLVYQSDSTAAISFRASHPASFASFGFSVARVSTLLPSASATGIVNDTSANGFIRSGDLFSKSVPVTTLFNENLPLGDTPCARAAFAESLHVYALATNGYGRLSYLDAPRGPTEIALRGFALTLA